MTTLFKNNAASTLSAGLAIGATSMNLVVGDNFPVVVAPDVAYLTIENATNFEIVKVTARALGSNTPTIVRAQDGTTDRAWLTGAVVSLRWTSASAQSAANAQQVSADADAAAAAALAAHVAHADPHTLYALEAAVTASLAGKQNADAQLDALSGVTAGLATGLATLATWTIEEAAGVLYFKTGGVAKAKLDASGNLTVVGNVTAYGTM